MRLQTIARLDTVARLGKPPTQHHHHHIGTISNANGGFHALSMPSPLTTTFVQSSILNAISNILAQLIDQRKNTVSHLQHQLYSRSDQTHPCPDSFHTEHTATSAIRHIWDPHRPNQLLLATRPGGAVPGRPLAGGDLQSVALVLPQDSLFTSMASLVLLIDLLILAHNSCQGPR